jgi:hypothetical protein
MRLLLPAVLVSLMALSACESVTERVQERFGTVAPKSRVFPGDQQAVGAAVVIAFKRLEFEVNERPDVAGRIEASGRIRHDNGAGDERQLVARVSLHDASPGQIEVQILLSEQVVGSSPGQTGEQALREHGFYGTFFETVQAVLAHDEPNTAPAPGK